MAITPAMVKELRQATNAGILDCKNALVAHDGDFDKAVEHLRQKGLAKAAKKASREAKEGLVALIVSDEGRRASMIKVNCETDFVVRNEYFTDLVDNLLQKVHSNSDITDVNSLLAMPFDDTNKTVDMAIQEVISKFGENIVIGNVVKYYVEGNGFVHGYTHFGNKIGVMVELGIENGETDSDILKELANDVALQITAMAPLYLRSEDVPSEIIEGERSIYLAQLAEDKKPDHIKALIIDGKLKKYYKERCLLEQLFVKDDKMSVGKYVQKVSKAVGIPIIIKRFTRFQLGN
ncbi:MAG: translation elongation factor Ts [Anaerolineaceae bacterium 4572_78]|nr:MAG: translation elongation factor Ts [Anaerolineaceae bacterium 4572_78]